MHGRGARGCGPARGWRGDERAKAAAADGCEEAVVRQCAWHGDERRGRGW
eukprot:CAMPEP_0183334464 /NCGR_PEP_ID=MMETSP0164_2-20130417/3061_1 /TAXON_ID=221442 /ORGANISM="Coccolithus pelagicus ssp braarudi, Strain PLY182g" /LENGTH=49 /DNA_ID= /DNA_START= /DNA_END= /DNA_ORIENTATION=